MRISGGLQSKILFSLTLTSTALAAATAETTSTTSTTMINPATAPQSRERAEPLTMAVALAKAYKNNPTLVTRHLQQELNEINYSEAWSRMWLPSVGLNVSTAAAYTMAKIPGSAEAAPGSGSALHGNPVSGTTLQLGQYNLYNFGRDADQLRIAELEIDRNRESVHEVERDVRFQVITAMFNFKTQQDLLEAAQRSVESAETVYGLVKQRANDGHAGRIDTSSSQIDLINARNVLVQIQTAYSQSLWALNLVLGDPIGHPYKVKTDVKYIKFRMPLDEVLAVFRQNAPAVKDARKNLEQSEAALRIAEKNSLPLPTVSFSGVNFGYNFTPTGTNLNREPGNWNFQVGLNLTVPLIGQGGFLFERALHSAEVNTEIAEVALRNAANTTDVNARGLYTALLQTETAIELNQQLFRHSTEYFDAALGALQGHATFSHLDLKSAIEQLRTSELNLTSSILSHYQLKLQLADLIGVDRFPEENL